jgi:hypothetical protein
MVVLAAIVVDVVVVSVVWWASVTWSRRRRATARFDRELAGAAARAKQEPQPEVFDAVASGDYGDWSTPAAGPEETAGPAAPAGPGAPAEPAPADRRAATETAPQVERRAAVVTEQRTVGSAVDSARQLEPVAAAVSTDGSPRVSEVLRARLQALRDTPGLSVALEVNGTAPRHDAGAETGGSTGTSD